METFIWEKKMNPFLGGGFKYFLFSPLFVEDYHFDFWLIFSNGLKPPTRIHSILGNLLLVLFSPLASGSNPYHWSLQVQGFLLETVTAEIQAEKQKKTKQSTEKNGN